MYLNMLNNKEKECFLELAYSAISVDGKRTEEEVNVFNSYLHECQLVDYKVNRQDKIENVIADFKTTSKRNRKIILLELLGILVSDGEYGESEKKFMIDLAEKFRVKDFELKRMERWVEAFNDMVKEGYELIQK